MVKIIETNISMKDKEIMDHQSRVIEAESWDEYTNYYVSRLIGCVNHNVEFKCLTNLVGGTLPRFAEINNLKYDNHHLSCDVFNSEGIQTKKLAYLVEYK